MLVNQISRVKEVLQRIEYCVLASMVWFRDFLGVVRSVVTVIHRHRRESHGLVIPSDGSLKDLSGTSGSRASRKAFLEQMLEYFAPQ